LLNKFPSPPQFGDPYDFIFNKDEQALQSEDEEDDYIRNDQLDGSGLLLDMVHEIEESVRKSQSKYEGSERNDSSDDNSKSAKDRTSLTPNSSNFKLVSPNSLLPMRLKKEKSVKTIPESKNIVKNQSPIL
jgi:hypothetical protein